MIAFSIIALTFIFGVMQYHMIYKHDDYVDYQRTMVPLFNTCSPTHLPNEVGTLRMYLSCVSYNIGNPEIISYITNVALIPVTYLFTTSITKKPLAGIITIILLGTSWMWRYWTPSVTYSQEWTLFFITSLYLANRNSRFSALAYSLSIACKPLALLYFPILLYSSTRKTLPYIILPVVVSVFLFVVGDKHIMSGQVFQLNWDLFPTEPQTLWNLLSPYPELIFLMPLTIAALFFIKNKISRYLLFSILTVLSMIVLVDLFTNLDNQHYRLFTLLIRTLAGFGYSVVHIVEKLIQKPKLVWS